MDRRLRRGNKACGGAAVKRMQLITAGWVRLNPETTP
jgi:hypothetical protein